MPNIFPHYNTINRSTVRFSKPNTLSAKIWKTALITPITTVLEANKSSRLIYFLRVFWPTTSSGPIHTRSRISRSCSTRFENKIAHPKAQEQHSITMERTMENRITETKRITLLRGPRKAHPCGGCVTLPWNSCKERDVLSTHLQCGEQQCVPFLSNISSLEH